MNIKIENWSVSTQPPNPYTPPELWVPRLQGDVENHPRLGSMKGVLTSHIVDVKGRIVKTASGSTYELGNVSADYVNWCANNGYYVPTDEVPIKFQ